MTDKTIGTLTAATTPLTGAELAELEQGGNSRKVAVSEIWSGANGGVRVRVATTANITISTALNNGDTLDGITLATGDLVLVKDQSSALANGIYTVGVTPARAPAFDTWAEIPGIKVVVEQGTANADTEWLCTSDPGGTLETTSITFVKGGAGGGLVFIAAYSPSAVAALDITSGISSTYDEYELHLQNFIPATDSSDLFLRTSTNGGSSFAATGYEVTGGGRPNGGSLNNNNGAGTAIELSVVGIGNAATESGLSGIIRLIRPATSQYFTAHFEGMWVDGNGDINYGFAAGILKTTATVNAVRLLFSSGNITSGFAKLYGVQKS